MASIFSNHYRIPSDVKTFNLSGMGCSAGAIGVAVMSNLLRMHAMSYRVVFSAEILTVGWYSGKDRGKLLLNCFFCTGCSSTLVMNMTTSLVLVKYRLLILTRTNQIANDWSYHYGYQDDDDEGIAGFTISKDVSPMFSNLLRAHLITLGMSILPWREKLRYVATNLWQHITSSGSGTAEPMPDFRTAVDNFCLPLTGRPMIRRLWQKLRLGEREMEAALETFHRFGNQSAASLWYHLAYLEAKGRVQKGDTVWQLGIGSGLKANNLVWVCNSVAARRDVLYE